MPLFFLMFDGDARWRCYAIMLWRDICQIRCFRGAHRYAIPRYDIARGTHARDGAYVTASVTRDTLLRMMAFGAVSSYDVVVVAALDKINAPTLRAYAA